MVSTFTPNVQLEEPARGDDVGTWDTPVNGNTTNLDLMLGAINTISLNNSNVVLSAAQYRSKMITFNSTLTGSVAITFPTSFTKSYEIQNSCTGSSAFIITLATTTAGGASCCPPPGTICEVVNSGTGLFFKNLPPIGTYMDFAGSSLPAWVSGSNPQPWLNCDGTSLSSANYPVLFGMIGATLPDSRGRVRAALNQTSNRMLSSNGGVDGNTLLAGGGADTVTLASSQLPANIPNSATTVSAQVQVVGTAGDNKGATGNTTIPVGDINPTFTTTVTINPSGGAPHSNVPPAYIGGLTLIRAG